MKKFYEGLQHGRSKARSLRDVGSYSNRNWVGRWLYNGLHSLNFQWLYNYRPLFWDIVVITFMVGGTVLCVTSLVLAWRVLGRRLRPVSSYEADRLPATEGQANSVVGR